MMLPTAFRLFMPELNGDEHGRDGGVSEASSYEMSWLVAEADKVT